MNHILSAFGFELANVMHTHTFPNGCKAAHYKIPWRESAFLGENKESTLLRDMILHQQINAIELNFSICRLFPIAPTFIVSLPTHLLTKCILNVNSDALIDKYAHVPHDEFIRCISWNVFTEFDVILAHINSKNAQLGVVIDPIDALLHYRKSEQSVYLIHVWRYLQLRNYKYRHNGITKTFLPHHPFVYGKQDTALIELMTAKPFDAYRRDVIAVQDYAHRELMRERALCGPILWYLRVIVRHGAKYHTYAYIIAHIYLSAYKYNDAQIWAIIHDPIGAHLGSVLSQRRRFGGG